MGFLLDQLKHEVKLLPWVIWWVLHSCHIITLKTFVYHPHDYLGMLLL